LVSLWGASAVAGPEKIAFPADYASWERYAVVERYDTKQYRELYTQPDVVKAVREGKPIPRDTVIAMAIHAAEVDAAGNLMKGPDGKLVKGKLAGVTVMEKREGFGTEYPAELRNGEWEYAGFLPDGEPNPQAADTKSCFQCHKPHEQQDFVISLASLAGKFPTDDVAAKTGANDVNIVGFTFGPNTVKAKQGASIQWTNGDDSPHQVTVAGKPLKTDVLLKGQTASLTFEEPGTYDYSCALHPGMKGKIEVTE
jgi:plastocyanin